MTYQDRYFFQSQLENWWNCIPEMILVGHQKGTRSNDDKYFPALLFQVIALSLLFLPPTAAIDLEVLQKGESLHALSAKYSDFGCTLMTLLGRHFPTISSIQHDLLRSAWLKTSNLVPESWHTLSQAIRQAQEIGLHEDKKGDEGPGSVADKLCQIWHDEYRKRLWLNLFMWDIQMAMMLGRPTTIDTNTCKFTPPVNCSMPKNLSATVPELLKEGDTPSPFTERLLQYQLTLQILKMTAMGANRPFPRDPSIISTLHQEALSFLNSIPATLRHQNPDTRWDTECPFLIHQREFLLCGTLCYLLALHRPHISTISKSRDAALQAAFMILESQQRLFKHVSPQYYKLHSITFFNFDASVQLSAILLSQPAPEASTVERALRCIGLSINLLEAVAEQSALAKASLPVVKALHQRLQGSLHVDHEEVSPALPKLPLDIVLTPRPDVMGSGGSDNTITDSLWTFDYHSTQLSLNFGSSWDSFGSEKCNSHTLPLDSIADHATLPSLPGQGVSANGFVNDSSGADLLAQMDISTDEHFPHWYID
ncbi:hypothetical protein BP6252_00449 [Coleophoma cylindrospora]|uniref:Xylanolytic transcriptional activator regulatory domain-containing protein n=1 Tax=Coleophoma cylindrospora TaxID=1849047 RepID=A0A3D8SQ44_9HELO|nr:hypothetical protein BP6252_00449 [Coleophoma cylindrospora]